MVNFTRKRLQVFVSSTYEDLKHDRQAAVEAILTAGHIPAGMELFTSGDESQMEVIKQWIDESDVYLLILGGRYGSLEPVSGKSYTHLEYDYAVSQGKPLFACVINENALEQRTKDMGSKVLEMAEPKKLKEFRTGVLSNIAKFWSDAKDIKITIGETLAHISRKDDLVGWVRADTQADVSALADEIARLSKENGQLRTQIGTGAPAELILGLSFEDLKSLLAAKNCLEYFAKFGRTFGNRQYYNGAERDLKPCKSLGEVGLIMFEGNVIVGGYISLTSQGLAFLNKLEFQGI